MIAIAIGPLVQASGDRRKEQTDRTEALAAALLDAIGDEGIRMVCREVLMEMDRSELVDRVLSGAYSDMSPASMARHMAESFVESVEEDLADERARAVHGGGGHD